MHSNCTDQAHAYYTTSSPTGARWPRALARRRRAPLGWKISYYQRVHMYAHVYTLMLEGDVHIHVYVHNSFIKMTVCEVPLLGCHWPRLVGDMGSLYLCMYIMLVSDVHIYIKTLQLPLHTNIYTQTHALILNALSLCLSPSISVSSLSLSLSLSPPFSAYTHPPMIGGDDPGYILS